MSYSKGDVVLIRFPYIDETGNKVFKPRPAIIYDVGKDGKNPTMQITKKNRSGKVPGFWITKNSSDGISLGIDIDSFISLRETVTLPERYIYRLIGSVPKELMKKIDNAMVNIKIKPKNEPN